MSEGSEGSEGSFFSSSYFSLLLFFSTLFLGLSGHKGKTKGNHHFAGPVALDVPFRSTRNGRSVLVRVKAKDAGRSEVCVQLIFGLATFGYLRVSRTQDSPSFKGFLVLWIHLPMDRDRHFRDSL